MNGSKIIVDTNICVYLINGDDVLADLLQDQELYISVMTEIELYAYYSEESETKILDTFIESVNILELDHQIKSKTIALRKKAKLKLPDTIIAASALANNFSLLSADRSFRKVDGLRLVFYEKSTSWFSLSPSIKYKLPLPNSLPRRRRKKYFFFTEKWVRVKPLLLRPFVMNWA